ncbi:unnamed protein product [Oikopleura dioica]|uniref:Carbohydrate kinase FGGY N-terminal domain-containing protein n=1 Tax=Oikopleura dioica TaxID=34765 RepID=E4XK59_OIKDI|nr:unnamed protein product [Oikopleura dioica]
MLVGIDLGTTNCKFLAEGQSEQSFRITYTAVKNESYKEIDPTCIVDNLIKCFDKLKPEKISGVAVTGQMHGIMCWDKNFNPTTNLITWEDTRCSQAFCDELSQGGRLYPGYGLATLLWLRKNDPICLSTAFAAGTIMDYFVARLTNNLRPRMPRSSQTAHSFGCWNDQTGWTISHVDELLLDVGKNLHDEIVSSAETNVFGIGPCRVLIGLGDHQCSVAGFGLPLEENVMFLNVGTSAQMTFLSKEKVNENGSVEIRPFIDSKTSLVTVASMNGGNVLSAFVGAYDIEFSAIEESLRNLDDVDKIAAYTYARFFPERCGLQGHGKLPLHNSLSPIETSISLIKSLLVNLKSLFFHKNEDFVLPYFDKIIVSGGASNLFIPFLRDLCRTVVIAEGDAASGAIGIFRYVQNKL